MDKKILNLHSKFNQLWKSEIKNEPYIGLQVRFPRLVSLFPTVHFVFGFKKKKLWVKKCLLKEHKVNRINFFFRLFLLRVKKRTISPSTRN